MCERWNGPRTFVGARVSFVTAQRCWSTLVLALIVSISVLMVSCSRAGQQKSTEIAGSDSYSTTPPFSTKEPDNYQAVRNLTFVDAEGNSKTIRTTIARSGELRREATETGLQPIVYLDSEQGSFILLPREKVYAQFNDGTEVPTVQDEGEVERRIHTEPVKAKYQKLGNEMLGNRSVTRYRVVNTSADGIVSNDETLVWVDESLGMPVRTETNSSDKSRTTMELTEISVELDKKVFELPSDYQKISIAEIRRRMHRE